MLQTMIYELDAPPQADDPHDVSGVKSAADLTGAIL